MTKTFLVFLYQSLRSLIQCQHKQQHQDQQRINSIKYIVYHFIIFILMAIDNIAILLVLRAKC